MIKFSSLLKRLPLALLLAALALSLSGCVYFRLLQVKRDLANFSEKFDVAGFPAVEVVCKNPVLRDSDFTFLIGRPPSRVIQKDGESVWEWDFEKMSSTATHAYALDKQTLALHMREGKLVRVVPPENFLWLFPRQVFIETVQQAAYAEVLKIKRTARARMKLTPDADAQLPTHRKFLALVGPPRSEENSSETNTLLYHFKVVEETRHMPIIVKVSFFTNGLLKGIWVRWGDSIVDIEYVRES